MLINTNKNIDIMFSSQRILIFSTILFVPMTGVFASSDSDKGDPTTKTSAHSTSEHPPHDHQHNDHIKKLDE